jgi:hypothetical protein
MANALFLAYKQVVMGDGAITGFSVPDLEGGDQRVILIDTADDDPAVNTDQDLADIAGAARVATAALAGEAVTTASNTATYDADDTTFPTVSGDQSEELVIYEHTGTEGTSLLIVSFDTFASGMPVTPNGGDIIIQWNASGIFSW